MGGDIKVLMSTYHSLSSITHKQGNKRVQSTVITLKGTEAALDSPASKKRRKHALVHSPFRQKGDVLGSFEGCVRCDAVLLAAGLKECRQAGSTLRNERQEQVIRLLAERKKKQDNRKYNQLGTDQVCNYCRRSVGSSIWLRQPGQHDVDDVM